MLAVLFLSGSILTGCADGVFTAQDETVQARRRVEAGSKFRHAHLLDRAIKSKAIGKSASSSNLGLVIAVASGVDKQHLLERYRLQERYQLQDRYDYHHVFDGSAWTVEDTTGANDFQQLLDELLADPEILWFEPDFEILSLPSIPLPDTSGQVVPWNVIAVGGTESSTVSGDGQGAVDVDLFILDTGVTNGDLNLVEALDFNDGLDDASDYDGHGTHIAGIAAATDDTDGLVGVAPGARVHNLKVLGDNGTGDVSQVIAAIEYLTAQKLANPSTPMVVNLSLGENVGTASYTALDDAVAASTATGVVYIVAAGNQGIDAVNIAPAHAAEAITVGAYDPLGTFASYSNYGAALDLLAPGTDVVSLSVSANGAGVPVLMSGTSMAAPHVAGAAALYLSQHPMATPQEVRDALVDAGQAVISGVPGGTTTKTVWVKDF